jgi:signal transduction histidine kinase
MSIARSTAFRVAATFAAALVISTGLLFGFIYWQTALSETARIDALIVGQSRLIAGAPPEQILWIVRNHVTTDLHHLSLAGLFDADGKLIAGNLQRAPAALVADGSAQWVDGTTIDDGQMHSEHVIAVARQLADGRLLVMGRAIEELANLRHLVARALMLGMIPTILLALGAGAWVGIRTWRRVRSWQCILDRLRDGHLGERLPTRRNGDDVDQLAEGVNGMLDEMERLLGELHSVGNNIAHDLRTPLARVRAQLERTRGSPHSTDELERTIDKTIAGLDQSISITTSLLRIAEIEGSRRRDAFGPVDLCELAAEVAEFYEPAAEQKCIALRLDVSACPSITGDRDLLFEAVTNLVDNAIKFTPDGGTVELRVGHAVDGGVLSVADSGPGIPASARSDVFKRFFRFDRSRHAPGTGLGLSLVAAIVKLHGYTLTLEDGEPGCIFRMNCPPATPRDGSNTPNRAFADARP